MSADTPFKVAESGPHKFIWIQSDRISECMQYYRENYLDGIVISPLAGYERKDVDFLREHDYVKNVSLQFAKELDIEALQSLTGLELIGIEDNRQPIDFGTFPKLREVRVEWHRKMTISSKCRALRTLYLRAYKPKSKDITELPELPSLDSLSIVQSPINSIKGIGRFPKLKRLELSFLSKLQHIGSIVELENGELETLDCSVCRRIEDHNEVRRVRTLVELRFNDCGQISSIQFLDKLPNLTGFRFVDTNIADGKLTPCLRLDSVGFFPKKHYSHTPEEVEKGIASRKQTG